MDDLPVGVLAGGGAQQKLHYLEPDHLGTPRVVIHPVRNVAVWNWDLKGEVFGNSAPNQDPDLDGAAFVFDMRFPGQRFDSLSGLSYNYFRDYEADTGRYVQSDPIGLNAGVATCLYVAGSPANFTDPEGLCPCGDPQKLIENARNDTRDWSRAADRSDVNSGFGAETNKCNLFVDTSYEGAGYSLAEFWWDAFVCNDVALPARSANLVRPCLRFARLAGCS